MNNYEDVDNDRRYRYADNLTNSRNLNSEKMGQVFRWEKPKKNKKFKNRFSRNQSVNNNFETNEMSRNRKINEYESRFQDFNNEEEMRNFLLKNEIERESNFKNKVLKSNYLKNNSIQSVEEYEESINIPKTQNKTEIKDSCSKSLIKKTKNKKKQQKLKKKNSVTKPQKKAKQTKKTEEKKRKRRQSARIKKFTEQTRWLSNTGFQKYFGKPAFENYGRGNTNPVWGGPMYGNYLKTHNINPQRGLNHPKYEQVFISTQLASQKVDYSKSNIPRKCKDEYFMAQEDVEKKKNERIFVMRNKKVDKLGSIKVPDLRKTKRFSSFQNFEEEERVVKSKLDKKFGKNNLLLKKNNKNYIKKNYLNKNNKKKNQEYEEYLVNEESDDYDDLEEYNEDQKRNKENYGEEFTNVKEIPSKVSSTNFYRNMDKDKVFQWNPKNYVNVNPKLLDSIPFAGVNQRELNKKSRFVIN